MTLGQRIEQVRIEQNIQEYKICDIMCMSQREYGAIAHHGQAVKRFHLMMLLCNAENPSPFARVL